MSPDHSESIKERLRALLAEAMPERYDVACWKAAGSVFAEWLAHARALP